MLQNSFCHLDSVGPITELKLWHLGISTWNEALDSVRRQGIFGHGRRALELGLPDSFRALETGDSRYFCERLSASEMWRLWSTFRDHACFLDLETTGLSLGADITVAALCDSERVRVFVRDENLDELLRALQPYKLIVTFNGNGFDFPVLRSEFPKWNCKVAHLDLRYPSRRAGLTGGLKQILRSIGLTRPGALDEIGGWLAPLLWDEYKKGNKGAMETLKAYAVNDVVHLAALADFVHNTLTRNLPIKTSSLQSRKTLKNPHMVDRAFVRKLRSQNWGMEYRF